MSGLTAAQVSEMVASAVAAAMASQEPQDRDFTRAVHDATTSKVLADAPTPRTQSRAKATSTKAGGITRKLTKETVNATDDVAFVVSSTSMAGSLLTKGARVFPMVGDAKSPEKSLTVGVLRALQEDGVLDQLIASVAKVEKAAKIGAHSVKTEATS